MLLPEPFVIGRCWSGKLAPYSLSAPIRAILPEMPTQSDFRPFVLVVDRDPVTPALLRGTMSLAAATYELGIARDAETALTSVQQRPPDLIVLSAEMPGIVRWQSLVHLLRDSGARAPIILVSLSTKELTGDANSLGVRDHLHKPLAAPVVREALQSALADLQVRRGALVRREPPPAGPVSRGNEAVTTPSAERPGGSGEFAVLYALGKSVNSRTEIETILQKVVEAAVQLTGAEQGSLLLLDERTGELHMRAAKNFDEKFVRTFRLRTEDSLAGQALQTGKPLMLGGEADTRIKTLFLVRAAIYVPILVRGKAIGVLSVNNQRSQTSFDPRHQHSLGAIADYAAVAIDNAQLYRSLRDRAAALEIALGELESADQLKEEMIQNLSHELRTPLTYIKSFTETTLAGSQGTLTAEIETGLRTIARKTDDLTRILDNMRALTPEDQLKIKTGTVPVQVIVTPLVAQFEERARLQRVVIVPDLPEAPLAVVADPEKIQIVLRNLIDNAIKFSPDGGAVTVSARCLDDQYVEMVVSDTGLGIPADKLGQVFEHFYQVDGSRTRRFGGVGLGLAAAREIVRAHGSELTGDSRPGQGSIFRFRLNRPDAVPA